MVVGRSKRAAEVAKRLWALFLVAVVVAGCGTSGQGDPSAKTRVGAFAIASQVRIGAKAAQSPCTHQGSKPARPEIAARFCVAAEGAGNALRFTGDQDALIQLAKNAKRRGGLTEEEGNILKEWGKEYDVPVRGPESHPGRGFGSNPHYHVGPVQHIPIR